MIHGGAVIKISTDKTEFLLSNTIYTVFCRNKADVTAFRS